MQGRYSKKKTKKSGTVHTLTVVLCVILILMILGTIAFGGYWWYRQPKFHNLTLELGADTVGISDFMTKYGIRQMAAFVSDPGQVDLNRVGTTKITFRHGKKEETVTLTIQDTTPPQAAIAPQQTLNVTDPLNAAALVSDIKDMSATKVYFTQDVELPEDYGDLAVTIVVEDESGNKIQAPCQLSFRWMLETWTLELGDKLTKDDLLLDPAKDGKLLDQKTLDSVNESTLGEYMVMSTTGAQSNKCTVTVQDTRGPEMTVKNVYCREGEGGDTENNGFLEFVTDPSGVAEVRLLGEYDTNTLGTYPVTLEAEDNLGNITRAETNLIVSNDWDPPEFTCEFEPLTMIRDEPPDFLEGITAYDEVSGDCEITCDTGKLNMSKAGTYFVTYIAVDDVGNEVTAKRKIIVSHNAEDTKALVTSVAAKLSDKPEKLASYVRYNMGYNSDWGGEDPVWYGFKNKTGNCYVHALCLKALMDEKGIENQLIWTTDKSHYWLLVKFDDVWRHMDSTPGTLHSRYTRMTDKQRLSTLSGRKWDTSQWPAAE